MEMEGPGQRVGFQICCLNEVVILIMDFIILTVVLHKVPEPLIKE